MKTDLQKFDSPTPAMLLQHALEKGVDMQQLEKLMDLQERWEKKEAKKAFLDAMSLFQTKLPELKKTKVADLGVFKYNYADLGSITKAINPILNECGLSYRWDFKEEKEIMEVTCVISHRDGHSEQTTMKGGKDSSGKKNDIQQKGSTHTYLQRYTLIGALGLSTADSDVDGKGAAVSKKDLTDEEILALWQQKVNEAKTRLELKAIYLKEKKKVDADPKIQAIFKERENALPATTPKAVMP